jgi:EAL domain-containing protein (putative c-di-GMP-specific phosphodiesterase class I)
MPLSQQSGFRLYQPRQSDAASRAFRIESALKTAIERNELHLVYQPKVDTNTRETVGAEVLLRWRSEALGNVSPGEFIPVAERSGLIVDLGTWVLAETCRQIAAWRDAGRDCPPIAVNLASEQLRQPDFCGVVKDSLQRFSIDGRQLNLELTESSLVDDIEGAIKIMKRLRRLGITFSIDDFGTGFSSLNYLGKMPISLLKIDRTFIAHVPDRDDDMKLVRSIVNMGHDLGVKIVAEGVETEEQLAFLRSIDCDQVQGFLVGRPLAAERFAGCLGRKGITGAA